MFKDKVMQLARQGKISLEEDSTATDAITIEGEHVNGNKGSCNTVRGDNITSNEDILFETEDSSNADDCMSTITFTNEDLLLGSKPHNHPLFVAGYVHEQKVNRILINGGSAVNILHLQILKELGIPIDELSNSHLMIREFNQGGQRGIGIICMQLTMEDMVSSALFYVVDTKTSYNMLLGCPWLHENAVVTSTWHQYFKYCRNGIVKKVLGDNKLFTEVESHFANAKYYIDDAKKGNRYCPPKSKINLKQPSKPPLKGFVTSTQEDEGRHEALAIDENGFYPKAFKLLIKARYNPKEKLSLGKLPPEATDKRLHRLNAVRMMLKEKAHAIQDSRIGLDFTPPKLVRIAIKSIKNNYVSRGFSSTEDLKREENLREFVFNRLGPNRKAFALNSQ
ncbi:UNVERIFIED_CONTAM: hypothetical protein Scaly_0484600 [Sesamum calycinum]|uniref:Uncharacterized protein n=1 Tax=Sesamum calycinum TaxID=2727403 RepID=A0AAW2RPE7_9LAMI